MVIDEQPINIDITKEALNYLKSTANIQNKKYITLGVKSGGCSGFQYVWDTTDNKIHERIEWSDPLENILLLDPLALIYMNGSIIDYVTELGGSFLKVINPTASNHCGCGESFGV